ncbi:MAG: oligosaccharide flippase family protein [Chloroflexi bacterium]|nr:oligosaccharide flippase family protein [Chloroflexota bacterium]
MDSIEITDNTGKKTKKESGFFADTLKIVSGTGISQIISIIVVPILARIFSPADFGILSVINSINSIVSGVSSLGYERAIMLPEKEKDASNLLGLAFLFAALTGIISALVLKFAAAPITRLLNIPQFAPYTWVIPLFITFSTIFIILNQWNTRHRKYYRLSISNVISSLTTSGIQLLSGLLGLISGISLVFGAIIGQVAAALSLGFLIWRDDAKSLKQNIHWEEMVAQLHRYKKFPIYATPSTLLNTISWQLPTFFLATFFSPTIVGYYDLGNRVIRMPLSIIAGALSQVFYQRAAQARIDGTLTDWVERIFRTLINFGMFPMAVMTIIGQDVFIVVFGVQWREAGVYTQILSIWMFFWFISSPLSTLFFVLEKQEYLLRLNIFILITRVFSLGVGSLLRDARLAIMLFAVSGIVVYGYLCISIIIAAKVSWKRVLEIQLSGLYFSIPVMVLLAILKLVLLPSWEILISAGIIFICYYAYMIYKDPLLNELFRRPLSMMRP